MANVAERFLLCVAADGYPASLEARKIYRALPDQEAEERGLIRVIDESGEDYLYPQRLFVTVELPDAVAEALLASDGAA